MPLNENNCQFKVSAQDFYTLLLPEVAPKRIQKLQVLLNNLIDINKLDDVKIQAKFSKEVIQQPIDFYLQNIVHQKIILAHFAPILGEGYHAYIVAIAKLKN